ncbi:MAG TPA: TolC family protein, partial [Polyangiaceae bacterium]
MSFGRTTVFAACLVGIASAAGIARADATDVLNAAAASLPTPNSAPTRSRVLSLKRCLELAALNYPKVQEARAKLDEKRAQLDQAYTSPYSDFTLTGGLGPAPSVHGSAVYTPDTDKALSDHMGLAWQLGVTGAIPLWTFGKITNLWDAADAQVKVGEHEIRKEQNEVKLNVRRAY